MLAQVNPVRSNFTRTTMYLLSGISGGRNEAYGPSPVEAALLGRPCPPPHKGAAHATASPREHRFHRPGPRLGPVDLRPAVGRSAEHVRNRRAGAPARPDHR